MRLIHTTRLELQDFFDSEVPTYAILSHCWANDEVKYQDFLSGAGRNGDGWRKIVKCCDIARSHDLEWAWIDTCCIDKTSTAELSEAINSMYRWYKEAAVCFALLLDYDSAEEFPKDIVRSHARSGAGNVPNGITRKLEQSRWFTRGWTLQELLAPSEVHFYDRSGVYFGSRQHLAVHLAEITGIDVDYLQGQRHIFEASNSCRMSWASKRQTTRKEDIAYCLLGIFNIYMPLLYGEGIGAFRRLQESIVHRSSDQTIFAWDSSRENEPPNVWRGSILARSPADFTDGGSFVPRHLDASPCRITSVGLQCFYVRGPLGLNTGTFPFTTRHREFALACSDVRLEKGEAVFPGRGIVVIQLLKCRSAGEVPVFERVHSDRILRGVERPSWQNLLRFFVNATGTTETSLYVRTSHPECTMYSPRQAQAAGFLWTSVLVYVAMCLHLSTFGSIDRNIVQLWVVFTFLLSIQNEKGTFLCLFLAASLMAPGIGIGIHWIMGLFVMAMVLITNRYSLV